MAPVPTVLERDALADHVGERICFSIKGGITLHGTLLAVDADGLRMQTAGEPWTAAFGIITMIWTED